MYMYIKKDLHSLVNSGENTFTNPSLKFKMFRINLQFLLNHDATALLITRLNQPVKLTSWSKRVLHSALKCKKTNEKKFRISKKARLEEGE